MQLDQVHDVVKGVPHMTKEQAARMTRHIERERPSHVLELGFRHGVSTCYIAAALDEIGRGHVTTVDLESARTAEPNVEELLVKLGLRDRVTVHYEPTSYTWRMMRWLEENRGPTFDLCYLDGAHSWFVDGFAFYLVDHFLEEGGWIVLDDVDWTYDRSPALADEPWVQDMPVDERTEPQVRKVYELLVKSHPDYGNFRVEEDWAFAQKLSAGDRRPVAVEYVKEHYGLGRFLETAARSLRRRR